MNRLAFIRCLVKGHRWGPWLPGTYLQRQVHYRQCRRCGRVQDHPDPRGLELAMGWYCPCPRCGRRGMLVGSRAVGLGPHVVLLPCIYECLECLADDEPYRWERTAGGTVTVPIVG